MGSRPVTECGSCGSGSLESVLELPATPPTCAMLPVGEWSEQPRYPLELLRCRECTLVQLSHVVDPAEVFPPAYPYSSGNNATLRQHFADLAASLNVPPGDLVVDVGGNDGTFLSNLECRRVLIDPTDQIRKSGDGIAAVQGFFGLKLARTIRDVFGPARYVTAFNVLAHVADPHDFLEGVRHLLADDGVFVTENGDLRAILGGGWDFIYHEHLRYYDQRSLEGLLARHGLAPFERSPLAIHGGSFRTSCRSGNTEPVTVLGGGTWRFDWLRESVDHNRRDMRAVVKSLRAAGQRVAAVGATARATTLIGAYEFDVDDIEAVYEVPGSDKLGHYIPGTRIPVLDERALYGLGAPENVLLLLWHMEDRLVPNLRDRGYRGDIIVPLPQPRVVSGVAEVAAW